MDFQAFGALGLLTYDIYACLPFIIDQPQTSLPLSYYWPTTTLCLPVCLCLSLSSKRTTTTLRRRTPASAFFLTKSRRKCSTPGLPCPSSITRLLYYSGIVRCLNFTIFDFHNLTTYFHTFPSSQLSLIFTIFHLHNNLYFSHSSIFTIIFHFHNLEFLH